MNVSRPDNRVAADTGFSLAEMLVAVVLFGIVGVIVTSASVTALHHQTTLQDRNNALAQARTAVQRIDRDIRSANPLLAVSSTQLVVAEVQASVTRTMTYAVSASQLTVAETDTTSAGSTTQPTKVLLRNVVNTSATPLFSVSPVPGYVAPSGSGVTATTCAMAGTASYDPGCVGTITVQVMVQPSTLSSPVSLSDNGTELRNAP